jgi:hypothetical protein
VSDKLTVKIFPGLVEKMRAKAIVNGLPGADTLPDGELLSALIQAEIGPDNLRNGSPPRTAPTLEPPTAEEPARDRVSTDETGVEEPTTSIPLKSNVRGIHGSAGMVAPPRHLWGAWIHELKGMGMAWYKQLDGGDPSDLGRNSTFAWALRLKEAGIEPIIRYYQRQMFPGRLQDQAFEKMERYAAQGVVWCEIGNEPNLDQVEWHSRYHGKVSWQIPYFPRIIVENWIKDAERAVDAGARPGFYALGPTDWGPERPHERLSSVMFYRRMFEYVAAHPDLRERFARLFEPEKAWLAVHASTYGLPLEFDPFPPNEPPYDMCLRGYEVPLRYLRELVLGDVPVTVLSTEGGVFTKDSPSVREHSPPSSHEEHARQTIEMFDWVQEHSPLQAMCPWLISNSFHAIGHHDPAWVHDGWYDGGPPGFSPKPVVRAMKDTKPEAEREAA